MQEPPERRLGNLLGAAASALTDQVRDATERACGQSGAGPAALAMLAQSLRGASMDDLRRAVGLTSSGTVRLVDRLVAEGLVERRPGPDQRSLALVLTRQGRTVARRTLAARARALEEALQAVDADDRATLEPVLERLVAKITERRLDERASGNVLEGGWLCRLCDQVSCGRPDGRCPAATAAAGFTPTRHPE